jgi:DNA (cytosine-5)-methyltransferase 1
MDTKSSMTKKKGSRQKAKFPVISLYSGALGLDLGLEAAGFRVAVAVECSDVAVQTIRANRPRLPTIHRRIENVSTREILSAAGLRPGQATIVSAGPGCQAFSTAGKRRSFRDPRADMFKEFVRVVREARPRFFVMENVRGLLSAARRHRPLDKRGPGHRRLAHDERLGSAFRHVVSQFKRLGYRVTFDLLNAADYGVPQTRQRLIFIGSRDGEPVTIPEATHAANGSGAREPWLTLRQAFAGLRQGTPEYHEFPPRTRRYIRRVPAGGDWRDLPRKMQRRALGSAFRSWGGRVGFYRRLSWNKPSPSLVTNPTMTATTLGHPAKLRPLSIREYARIQQFPDDWQFRGSVRQKYEQIGNAVPVGLAKAIGGSIRGAMRGARNGSKRGVVECTNLNLLVRLHRTPTTILNPPRMRGKKVKVSDAWNDERRKPRHSNVIDLAAYRLRRLLKASLKYRRGPVVPHAPLQRTA